MSSGAAEGQKAFEELGVCSELAKAAVDLGWKEPTDIQKQAIPQALDGKDIIGLAQTGSGKTGAFALPILQELLDKPQAFFALVLSPTRSCRDSFAPLSPHNTAARFQGQP